MSTATNKDQLLLDWRKASTELAAIKTSEMNLRSQVVGQFFTAAIATPLPKGTENVELGNGYKLKAVFKLNYTLDNENDAVDKILTRMEKLGPEGQFIAERIIRWKPDLDVKEYERLDPKYKKLIDEVLTIKPGTPSLEFVEPKGTDANKGK
jgi:hypothetical protein